MPETKEADDRFAPAYPPVRGGDFKQWLKAVVEGAIFAANQMKEEGDDG